MTNVDIILPTYNCEKTIDETINSVINQSFKDWNLIVIDDASTDSTVIQIKQYLQIARITLLGSKKTQIALFVNQRGERLTRQWIWNILKICSKKANIDEGITPHTLRHSFATHMLQNGASLKHVKELLGHSSISTTQVYTHMTDQHMRQEYEKSHPRA